MFDVRNLGINPERYSILQDAKIDDCFSKNEFQRDFPSDTCESDRDILQQPRLRQHLRDDHLTTKEKNLKIILNQSKDTS